MWPDFLNVWPFARAKCCHNSNKVGKIRFKSLNCPRLLKFCQRGGILPNLVTLALICHLATIIVYHCQLEFSGVLLVQFNLFQHVVLPLEHDVDVLFGFNQRLMELQSLLGEVCRHLGPLQLGLGQLRFVQFHLIR